MYILSLHFVRGDTPLVRWVNMVKQNGDFQGSIVSTVESSDSSPSTEPL